MAPKKVVEKEAGIYVSRTTIDKKQETGNEKIKIRPFVTDTATVSIKFGATIPTVDYGNARVDVMLSCPCYKEEMVAVYHELRDLCDSLIEKEAARLTGEAID